MCYYRRLMHVITYFDINQMGYMLTCTNKLIITEAKLTKFCTSTQFIST